MPFFPSGVFNSPSLDENPEAEIVKSDFSALEYNGPLNGCSDYWPAGTGVEWFETVIHKTPVPQ
jgi:hypothetical protein